MKLDNVALVPGNLLPFKKQYQTLANRLPQGGILIVLPIEGQKQRVFEETAARLKRSGRRITTISVTRFIP